MSKPFEEQYEDVLQNIEFAIISTYRERPDDISDWSVEAALDALIRAYGAEHAGRTLRLARLSEGEQAICDRVKGMCEWRLGREQLQAEGHRRFCKSLSQTRWTRSSPASSAYAHR